MAKRNPIPRSARYDYNAAAALNKPIDMNTLTVMVEVYGAAAGLNMVHRREGILAHLDYMNPKSPMHSYRPHDSEYTAIRFHKTQAALKAMLDETDKHPILKKWVIGTQMHIVRSASIFVLAHHKKYMETEGLTAEWSEKLTKQVNQLSKRLQRLMPAATAKSPSPTAPRVQAH